MATPTRRSSRQTTPQKSTQQNNNAPKSSSKKKTSKADELFDDVAKESPSRRTRSATTRSASATPVKEKKTTTTTPNKKKKKIGGVSPSQKKKSPAAAAKTTPTKKKRGGRSPSVTPSKKKKTTEKEEETEVMETEGEALAEEEEDGDDDDDAAAAAPVEETVEEEETLAPTQGGGIDESMFSPPPQRPPQEQQQQQQQQQQQNPPNTQQRQPPPSTVQRTPRFPSSTQQQQQPGTQGRDSINASLFSPTPRQTPRNMGFASPFVNANPPASQGRHDTGLHGAQPRFTPASGARPGASMDPANNNNNAFASLNPRPFMGLTEEEIQDAKARAERDPDQNAAEDLQREQDRQTFIWGTAISVDDVQNRFRRFLENFILTKKDKQVKEGEGDDEDDEGGERNNAGDGEKDDGTNGSAEKRNEGAMDTDNNNNNNNEKDTDANAGEDLDDSQRLLLPTQTQSQDEEDDDDLLADSFYIKVMRLCHEKDNINLDIDCAHLESYDPWLYERLVAYPQELIPLFDTVANKIYEDQVLPDDEKENFRKQILPSLEVRPFNLLEKHAMRDLNPSDIDKMVAVKGMVTRCSAVIPELKGAYFKCLTCGASPEIVVVNRGRVNEPPLKCLECRNQGTMTLIHNRCYFANKQQVKMQETPDVIPEGATPNTVSMCVFDSLVDEAKPGDRVEVTGVYRAVPIRVAPNQRAIRSIYKTYLDIIHIRKDTKGKLRNTAKKDDNEDMKDAEYMKTGSDDMENDVNMDAQQQQEENDATNTETMASNISPRGDTELEFSPERIREIEELSRHSDIYERLAKSVAPSIWELEDIKKGILCQLFGATNKTFKGASANKVRGDINILLVGDPGVAKSQLLTYVHRVAPRGMYTSGSGSSAVGLTAYVSRDPETKDMVLESGALVLSDRGVCCIDEFDKMGDGARSMLHEVMEQQTVSIAKAGIIAVLNARTSVLASANPVGSRYNPNMSIVDNLHLPPTLLSRFDLLYLVLDQPNPETDRRLARHLVSLHYKDPPKRAKATVSAELLTDYISYAKQVCHPVLGEEAGEELVDGYVKMRQLGSAGGRKVVTATPRQLESLVRISEALARIRLSKTVDKQDSTEALRLMRVAMQSAAIDPRTGLIDMDKILTGHSAADRKQRSDIAEGVDDILQGMQGRKARLSEIVLKLKERNASIEISVQEVRDSALLLAEQDRAIVKGDLVQLI